MFVKCKYLDQDGYQIGRIDLALPLNNSQWPGANEIWVLRPYFTTGDYHLSLDVDAPDGIPGYLVKIYYGGKAIIIFTNGEFYIPISIDVFWSLAGKHRALERTPLAAMQLMGIFLTKNDKKIIDYFISSVSHTSSPWMYMGDIERFLNETNKQPSI